MPLLDSELRRGRIVVALFPFSTAFPLRLAGRRPLGSIEEYVGLRGGEPTELLTEARLRPVLLLHDRTRGEHGDVLCLRINSVKRRMRGNASWSRIERGEHPFFFRLALLPRYGLREESVIALSSIGAVHKSAIAGPRPVGEVDRRELQVISERLARLLSLDLSQLIAAQARDLIRRMRQPGS